MDGVAKFGFLKLVEGNRPGFLRLALHKIASGFEDVEFHKRASIKIDFGHHNKAQSRS
jgi:hypothetical protein